MMWTDDPVRDQIAYDMEQRYVCLHCSIDEGSECCEHCPETEEDYDYGFV